LLGLLSEPALHPKIYKHRGNAVVASILHAATRNNIFPSCSPSPRKSFFVREQPIQVYSRDGRSWVSRVEDIEKFEQRWRRDKVIVQIGVRDYVRLAADPPTSIDFWSS